LKVRYLWKTQKFPENAGVGKEISQGKPRYWEGYLAGKLGFFRKIPGLGDVNRGKLPVGEGCIPAKLKFDHGYTSGNFRGF
jgi:hypothetical protein